MTDTVSYKEWYAPGGGMMYNTWSLEPEHPMHPYNQLKEQGVNPEDFGIEHPYVELFKDKSRSELCAEILHLRKALDAKFKYEAMGVL